MLLCFHNDYDVTWQNCMPMLATADVLGKLHQCGMLLLECLSPVSYVRTNASCRISV